MRYVTLCAYIFAAIGFFPMANSAEKPTITWAFSDTRNLSKTAAAKTMSDTHPIFLILKNHLPEYNHEFFWGTVSRIENELKRKPLTCFPASSSFETRAGFSYLTPLNVATPPLIVIRKELAAKFAGKDDTISLGKVVRDREISGILIEARSYGRDIDKVLNRKDANIQRRVLLPIGTNTIQMVQQKRADYTVEYAYVIDEFQETHNLAEDVVVAPIEEAPIVSKLYVACSRTPEGHVLIQKIDEIIRKNVATPEYRKAMMAGTTPSKNLERGIDQFIKSRAKSSEIH